MTPVVARPGSRPRVPFEASPALAQASPVVVRRRARSAGPATTPHNLPAPLSSFVGRGESILELVRLLRLERLVTLTGPGGIGKTRLALQLAETALPEFTDGVWLVDLAAVNDPQAITQVAIDALGARQLPGRSVAQSLVEHLGERRVLLLFDSCEHLVDAVADAAETLLQACPRLGVLATSRDRLYVPGECVWPVPPLGLPGHGSRTPLAVLIECEAVRLFVDRVTRSQPSFALTAATAPAVVEICTRLDGIPLALELAAARASALSVNDLVTHLDDRFRLLAERRRDRPPRRRTMREALEWTCAGLNPDERTLFQRLGVFAGSFDLRAVEAVCADAALERRDIAIALARLVDRSLVRFEPSVHGGGRYRLLETMREYAREHIGGSQGALLRQRHARHYLAYGIECEQLYIDAQQGVARERYHAEYANARAALQWSLTADPELYLQLAGSWRFYWWLQGRLVEGRRWLGRALEPTAGDRAARARSLSGLGRLMAIQGDVDEAVAAFRVGLSLAESARDEFMIAELTHSLGVATVGGSTNQEAERHFRRAVDMWQHLGYRQGLSSAYGNLGECCFYAGNFAEARSLYLKQAAMGQENSRFYGLINLCNLERYLGNHDAARRAALEALPLATPLYAAVAFEALAFLAAAEGESMRAATLGSAAERLYRVHQARPDPMPHRDEAETQLRDAVRTLDQRTLHRARERGATLSLDELLTYATQRS